MTAEGAQSTSDSREAKLAALRERTLAEAGAVHTASDWTRCLRMAARLPGESFANILLIQAQRPDAMLVQGYEAWRAAGRQVSQGEQGIQIFSGDHARPARARRATQRDQEPEPVRPSWREAVGVTYVWDIAQTTGQAVHDRVALPTTPSAPPAELWDGLCWLARRVGFAVEREQEASADGATFWSAHRIRIPPGTSTGQAAWALTHQIAHVLMHDTASHLPGTTTTGDACKGIRRADADAVAFIICYRYGITVPRLPDSPSTWAGTDPRAQPAAVVLAAGEQVMSAAARIVRHLDRSLPGQRSAAPVPSQAGPAMPLKPSAYRQAPATEAVWRVPQHAVEPSAPDARAVRILQDAATFYSAALAADSWAAEYLSSRGIDQKTAGTWRIGYAPNSWTALTDHLRAAGYTDEEIEAAGLARRSSRGSLIDHFRDRVMLPVHDEHGRISGFIGRARPGAGPAVPKYLNSPDTSQYKKGHLLFGLWEARDALASSAIPVIVEGPFDAIAVTVAGVGRYAGLAPCGTALTVHQTVLLGQVCDLARTGVLVAFDDDPAGRKAAIRAYGAFRPLTAILRSAGLAGRDPAQILEEEGTHALRDTLDASTKPLLAVVVDAELRRHEHQLGDAEGTFRAMRAAAVVLASLLPADTATQIRQITGNAELAVVDDQMKPVMYPQLPEIARVLPADTAFGVTRLAERLDFMSSDVVIEIANAVTILGADNVAQERSARLASDNFPRPPLEDRHVGGLTRLWQTPRLSRPNIRGCHR